MWKRPFPKEMVFFYDILKQTERLRCQIQDILQVWKCKIWKQIWFVTPSDYTVNDSTWELPRSRNRTGTYRYAFWNYWSTLKDSAMKFKIYGTEMHNLSKNVDLSRVCGSVYFRLAFYIASRTQYSWIKLKRVWVLQVLNDFIYFANTSIDLPVTVVSLSVT